VNSEVQGIVMNILVEPGKEVRRGDVVIRINTGGHVTRTVELNRELARAEVEIARLQEKREKELVLAHAASQRDLELAILGVKHAEDALAVAEENYRNSLLTRSKLVIEGDAAVARDPKGREIDLLATISGTVFELNVQPGENLDPLQDQKNLLIIGDQLMFTAYFDQRYASSVRKGDKGKFYLRAYPGTLFEGEVVRVDAEVLPQTPKSEMLAATEYPFTFRIWMSCPASKGSQRKIMRGMNGYCLFERQFSSVAIPESALMRYSGRAGTVLAVDANRRLQVRNVTYSMADDGWVAIETGLKAKDLVVLDGQIALKPGDQVVAVQEK
jgi:multidrug efflux pump subunit AcrA (membrane-fusion protein)